MSVCKYNHSLPLVILNALILMYQFIYLVTKCAKFLTADIKRLCASIYQNWHLKNRRFFIFIQVFNLECVRLDLFNGFHQNRFKCLLNWIKIANWNLIIETQFSSYHMDFRSVKNISKFLRV